MRTVLVVDDEEEVRTWIKQALSEAGYRVLCAGDGIEALEVLGNEEEECLVLLDLIMPRMNGWRFREAQRSNPSLERHRVVVMSAAPTLDQSVIDADAILQKPVSLDRLLEVVGASLPSGDTEFDREEKTVRDRRPAFEETRRERDLEDSSPG